MKHYLFSIFNLLLIVLTLVYCIELKNKNDQLKSILDKRYELIISTFEDVEEGFIAQDKKIENYKRDCENITFKVINGEW